VSCIGVLVSMHATIYFYYFTSSVVFKSSFVMMVNKRCKHLFMKHCNLSAIYSVTRFKSIEQRVYIDIYTTQYKVKV